MPTLELQHNLDFSDLYQLAGLQKIDQAFLTYLKATNAGDYEALMSARRDPEALSVLQESEHILGLVPHVEIFITDLFNIQEAVSDLAAKHDHLMPLYRVKREFIQRQAVLEITAEDAAVVDGNALAQTLTTHLNEPFGELAFAKAVERLQAEIGDAENHPAQETLQQFKIYAAWATLSTLGRKKHKDGVLFHEPAKIDSTMLINHIKTGHRGEIDGYELEENAIRQRDGFVLTDNGADLKAALDEANYCIWCHKQGKDSCSKGLKPRKRKSAPDTGAKFRLNAHGVPLSGCPLEEKISEFQLAKSKGYSISALAIMTIDNPMVAATGHRICNECMKSCVYQKQAPVNIPQVETRVLKDVLALPWGFEIYSLLTRWNPLNFKAPLPLPDTGKKVLVAGMGPAGFTLAHYLIHSGHTVVGIDGLKIEPLPADLTGVTVEGQRVAHKPIYDVTELYESLDDRTMAGFGGVAEYGITVRWDKNFLKIIRLLLQRRETFSLIGGVRLGGTVSINDAWGYGFDHIALATGAGKPTLLNIPNGMAPGVRAASDFLMGLQLTGAAQKNSCTNLQLRLPILVVGGGLTAIDTATESMAYYVRHVEKFLLRYEDLCAESDEANIRHEWTEEETAIADEWLDHGRQICEERMAAGHEGRQPDITGLLKAWGGSTIVYRKRITDSPSYRLNHEEVEKALEEGVMFADCLSPVAVEVDQYNHVKGLKVSKMTQDEEGKWQSGEQIVLPAKSLFIAAGTQPNNVIARESNELFRFDGKYFQSCDDSGELFPSAYAENKSDDASVLVTRCDNGRFISFFGDLHPSFFGNVVKAMASAKRGYPQVNAILSASEPASALASRDFFDNLDDDLRAIVVEVTYLAPKILEVIVKAPACARNFQPGQFFRLQNYVSNAVKVGDTELAMEGLALTGAWVDVDKGLVSVIVLEMGGSSNLCRYLRPGEPVIFMGPTGIPTEIPANETVMLVGGGLGNAVLFSIGKALKEAGSKVLYFAGYKKRQDVYKIKEIEQASDAVVWCCDEADAPPARRESDSSFHGNIVQAMAAYGEGQLGAQPIPLSSVERIIAIGSDRMMAAVAAARHNELSSHLNGSHLAIGSINSPMQCMMKEICAQCVQPHVDPDTGERSFIFSCAQQDQPLDRVDWAALNQRLGQNSIAEKMTKHWIGRCMAKNGVGLVN